MPLSHQDTKSEYEYYSKNISAFVSLWQISTTYLYE